MRNSKKQDDINSNVEIQEKSELQNLIDEKVTLATTLGLMNDALPSDESYKHTDEYKRIQEIDKQLWGLI